jgi:hypothetical protein
MRVLDGILKFTARSHMNAIKIELYARMLRLKVLPQLVEGEPTIGVAVDAP